MKSTIKLTQDDVTVEITIDNDQYLTIDDCINSLIKPALYGAGYNPKSVDEYFTDEQ